MSSLREFLMWFDTEEDYVRALALVFWTHPDSHYWPYGSLRTHPVCPFCESRKVRRLKSKRVPPLYQCNNKGCRKQFNIFTGTPFQGTRVKLEIWFKGYWYFRYYKRKDRIPNLIGLSKRDAGNLHKKIKLLDRNYGHEFPKLVRRQLKRWKKWRDRRIHEEPEYHSLIIPLRR